MSETSDVMTKFHSFYDLELNQIKEINNIETSTIKKTILERNSSYRFYPHFHPYVRELIQRLVEKSTGGLQAADTEVTKQPNGTNQATLFAEIFSNEQYVPSKLVQKPYPVKELDFSQGGAYSLYNWELFFHVPLTIGIHLSKNQRFAEAQRWFHYLFDPTDTSDEPMPERYWKVKPFKSTDVKKIEEFFINLSTNADPTLCKETIASIEAWKGTPFRPHVVARCRQQSYMIKTIMAYLDNLIAWGDSLFRQDTGESIDEALMLYVLAANILGPRPQAIPKKGSVRPQTYANLREDLDAFGNAMREMEADVAFNLMPLPREGSVDHERLGTVRSLGKALYFCVPQNDKLLRYWDTVADRLFKIRNSLNIQGVFHQLALFEPPIDPALLAGAAAAGLNVGAIANGINQPLPLVRFQFLLQKAADICQEVKSLGNHLLTILEKEDGEALTLLRAKHEHVIMERAEQVKYAQWQEAIKSREGLLKSLALVVHRYTYYEKQLGKKAEQIVIPEIKELDKESLEKMRFTMQEAELAFRDNEIDIVSNLSNEERGRILNTQEASELTKLREARAEHEIAANYDRMAGVLSQIPDFGGNAEPMGVGATITFGGRALAAAMNFRSSFNKSNADRLTYVANTTAKVGSYIRREQDWAFQSNLAAGEVTQIFKQFRAAQIREVISELELKSHRQQMKHAEEIEQFLNEAGTDIKGKTTNKSFYAWMKREVKGLYAQCFQFAFDIAKKAERALQHELGDPGLRCLEFGYLAGKEGLLAGEKLLLDVKRMEMKYHELNQREYELAKHISLLQLNPLALLELRATGRCTVIIPEALFDMDGPGHYFRRLKTVALTIPCIVGPYTSVNCKLTLLKSSIRKTSVIGESYPRKVAEEDDRFTDYFGSLQSVVVSSAQNDSGLFETNLHDERYLPFEGSGVISEWQIELPSNPSLNEPCQFDYKSIADIILHFRYTAREGGSLLRKGALANIKDLTQSAEMVGNTRLFSVREEFPSEWAKFKNAPSSSSVFELSLNILAEHYPFWSQGRLNSVKQLDIVVQSKQSNFELTRVKPNSSAPAKIDLNKTPNKLEDIDLYAGKVTSQDLLPEKPIGNENYTFRFTKNTIENLWLAVTWFGSK